MAKPSKPHPGGWLFKEEPDHYSLADLERDGETVWDGVANNLALKNLREVRPGDAVLFYQTGKDKAVVGEMIVTAGPMADPSANDPKLAVVKVKFARRWPRPVTLAEIKDDPLLAGWDLVRLPRLSVMRVGAEQWRRLAEISRKAE